MTFHHANPEPRSAWLHPRRFEMPSARPRPAERVDFVRYQRRAVTVVMPRSFFASLLDNLRWWWRQQIPRRRADPASDQSLNVER